MKSFLKTLFVGFFGVIPSLAFAGIIDFISLADGSYGEGAWDPLTLTTGGATLTITGHATAGDNDQRQFAYLDAGRAGLGVCKDVVNSAKVNTMVANRTANNCDPSSDDNVNTAEFLRFVFDVDVRVNNLWFNNNHDNPYGFTLGDMITIDGNNYGVTTGYAGGPNGIGSFYVAAGQYFDVAFYNRQFYISGIEVSRVAEPGSLLLFGLGLLALVGVRRKQY
jgi:hypothetical protein